MPPKSFFVAHTENRADADKLVWHTHTHPPNDCHKNKSLEVIQLARCETVRNGAENEITIFSSYIFINSDGKKERNAVLCTHIEHAHNATATHNTYPAKLP